MHNLSDRTIAVSIGIFTERVVNVWNSLITMSHISAYSCKGDAPNQRRRVIFAPPPWLQIP